MITENTETRTRRYRGLSYRRPIDAAKEAVPVIDLADRLCGPGGLRRIGEKWVAHCPLPDHEDRSPSFTVYPETDSFFCYGCLRGGDVIKLASLAWGYDERDAHVAAANLLHQFGHDIPQRPPAWFRKQERQKATRDAIEKTQNNIRRRRLFRYLILPHVDAIEDEEERNRELDRAWSDFRRFML
jgi:DNA primase